MKKNKAFTLVELLAIITILGVMVILVVPQIGGSINSKKEKELEKIIDIIESAGKAYHSFNNDVLKISIDTLVNEKYLTNDLTNPVTNEKLDGCVRVFKDNNGIFNYKYTTCERVEVPVTIELKGGTSSQFSQEITQNTYDDSTRIELVDPTKQNSDFKKWQVVKGNSYINGKTLIVGDTETIVYAIWENYPTLTLNLNEGLLDQSLNSQYKSGTNITLKTPTREGYTFAGWSVNEGEGNSIVSGNNFTMGSIDTILTANWLVKPVSFADDSWTTIKAAVSSGNTDNYNVGDTKTVDLGSLGTHTLRIANKTACDGTLASQTACGFVIEFADVITTHVMNSTTTNAGGWPASAMRTYVNGDIYNALPEGLRNAIIDTTVVSSHGSEDSSNFTSTDKVYLLSTREVWGKEGTSDQISYDSADGDTITRQLYDSADGDTITRQLTITWELYDSADGDTITRQLDYYSEKGVTTSSYSEAIKQYSGTNSYWWLRSADSNGTTRFYTVSNDGNWYNCYAFNTDGVSPAFRLG